MPYKIAARIAGVAFYYCRLTPNEYKNVSAVEHLPSCGRYDDGTGDHRVPISENYYLRYRPL